MKSILTASALFATLATATVAADFDNTTFTLGATTGALDFMVRGNSTENVTAVAFGVTAFEHQYGAFDAAVRGEVNYNFVDETVGIRAEYQTARQQSGRVVLYGEVALDYTTPDADLTAGSFTVEPSIGVLLIVTDRVRLFGEVGYAFDASNDFADLGGYVEVGLPIDVTDSVTFTPSLVRGFNDGTEETNLNVALVVAF